jgi:hypothetical protein
VLVVLQRIRDYYLPEMYSIFKTKFNAKFIYSTCQNKSFIIKDYESALFLELLNIYIAITLKMLYISGRY